MQTAILPRSAFRSAIAAAVLGVERHNTIPVLSNVRLCAAPGGLNVIGTDLDMEITAHVPGAVVDLEFDTTTGAHTLRDLEKKAPKSDNIAIDVADAFLPMPELVADHSDADLEAYNAECERVKAHNATITDTNARLDFEGFRASMQTIPAHDFPTFGDIAAPVYEFDITTADLRAGLERVAFAISTEETRYYLNGIFMHVSGGMIRFVATDGHRLARHDLCAAPEGAAGMAGVIIPRKTVETLYKLLKGKGAPEMVHLRVNTSKMAFHFGNIVIASKLIDGTFPAYDRVIPSGNDKRATFEPAALARSIECVSAMSSERGRAVKIEIENGNARLSVNNPNEGSSVANVPCDYTGAPISVGFNAKYVLDILSKCVGERVTFDLADSGSPAVIKSNGAPYTLFVLMPMRV